MRFDVEFKGKRRVLRLSQLVSKWGSPNASFLLYTEEFRDVGDAYVIRPMLVRFTIVQWVGPKFKNVYQSLEENFNAQ